MIRHYTIPRNYRNPPHQTLFDIKFYNEILSIPSIGLCRITVLLSTSTHRIRSYVKREIPQKSFISSYRMQTQSSVTSLRFRIDVRINSLYYEIWFWNHAAKFVRLESIQAGNMIIFGNIDNQGLIIVHWMLLESTMLIYFEGKVHEIRQKGTKR